ncbi:MAG: Asp-tRNA(Asn)/Glu-tRNA(Gln) amidotransferase subunit GatC [Pseudomonadota bacterium]|nr:Asp-tRNA(Asn)/Glu-tRNA(Gln) amidotransferase subunit GatC [Pseudomonadota bacterium]
MSIDKTTVKKIARLARIRIGEAECDKLTGQLGSILDWVKQLNEVDTQGIAPMTGVVAMDLKLREDEVTDGGIPNAVLQNAPEAVEGFFVVPKIVE